MVEFRYLNKGIILCAVFREAVSILFFFFSFNICFKAHKGSVRGVAVDGLNQLTVTTGSEGLLKFWNFKNKILIHSMSLDSSPNMMLLHRDR